MADIGPETVMIRAEFARLVGARTATITNWAQAGMPSLEDGRIPVLDALRWVAARPTRSKRAQPFMQKARDLLAQIAGDEADAVIPDPAVDGDGARSVDLVRQVLVAAGHPPGPLITYQDAALAERLVSAASNEMKRRQAEGELIERRVAEREAFAWARRVRDAWLSWPARVSAEIAGELGAEVAATERVLDRHVRAHLIEIGEMKEDDTSGQHG